MGDIITGVTSHTSTPKVAPPRQMMSGGAAGLSGFDGSSTGRGNSSTVCK